MEEGEGRLKKLVMKGERGRRVTSKMRGFRGGGNNYLLPISRVLQGRTENFEKKSVFQRGFETFLSVFHPEL